MFKTAIVIILSASLSASFCFAGDQRQPARHSHPSSVLRTPMAHPPVQHHLAPVVNRPVIRPEHNRPVVVSPRHDPVRVVHEPVHIVRPYCPPPVVYTPSPMVYNSPIIYSTPVYVTSTPVVYEPLYVASPVYIASPVYAAPTNGFYFSFGFSH